MDIRQLLTYSDNCRRSLHETLIGHPDAFGKPFETAGEYKTIRSLIAHCIGAEQRWTERIQGQPRSPLYEDCAAESLSGLFMDWERIRAKTRSIIDDSRDASQRTRLHHEVTFTLPGTGYTDMLTVEECLFQIFNHQTYHLGQITFALQQMSVDPPYFDYVALRQVPDQD